MEELVPSPMRVHVQGRELDLAYTNEIRPTVFSLFLANTMVVSGSEQLACDLGTGGGIQAIALALLGVEKVVAVDLSAAACEVAAENVRRNGVENQVEVVHGDIAAVDLRRDFDLVVSNPPTMPGRPGTPTFAAAGGDLEHREFLRIVAEGLPTWIRRDGQAQVALSSLVSTMVLADFKRFGLRGVPRATLVAPFRDFYEDAYDSAERDGFVAAGQALVGQGGTTTGLSEFITVYDVARER